MEDTPLTFVQKKYRETLTFRFEEGRLVRVQRDYSGENNVSVHYNDVDVKNWTKVKINHVKRFRPYMLSAIILAFLSRIFDTSTNKNYISLVFILIFWVLGLAMWLNFFTTTYTVFKINGKDSAKASGIIKIMYDANHDRIVSELNARWAKRMRQLADTYFGTDPAKSIAKSQWLRDNDLIDQNEFQHAVDKIHAGQATRDLASPNPLGDDEILLN